MITTKSLRMPLNAKPRLISCDEAGYTGPKLLDDNQPYFAYAAIDLTPDEARKIVSDTRAKHHIQAPELKASLLQRQWSNRGIDRSSKPPVISTVRPGARDGPQG